MSLTIKRYYTRELDNNPNKTVYDMFNWKKVDVLLKDYKTGEAICDMKDLEFPIDYSQQACDIIASKYFRKVGVPNTGSENSMRQVAHRMVDFWVSALVEEGIIEDDNYSVLYDELVYGLLGQIFAPNSPQWFNTGLERSYGIKGGKIGNYYYDEESGTVKESEDSFTRTQASACFITSIEDKLLGEHSISEQYATETKLFKGGSGTGSNFSKIRAKGEALSGGGTSSGVLSFLEGLDRNAGTIKSGGASRRSAKMVSLDIDHPEIEDFISWKAREEEKVKALVKMGYDGSIGGEAYETVSGQNSNNSIRFSDEFMKKVANLDKDPNATITLKGRVDSAVNKEVKVADLWELFNKSAWECADPAPQFDDTFNSWHTCPLGEDGDITDYKNRINATNPCGEYAFLDNTSCNLASINIYKFYNPETKVFYIDGLIHTINIIQLLLEASIIWGHFPTKDIAYNTYAYRTTGLGFTNLASLLLAMGIPYDSPEARAIAAVIMSLITGQSYLMSSMMAKEVGPFKAYERNKDHMLDVVQLHAYAVGGMKKPSSKKNVYIEQIGQVEHDILNDVGLKDLSDTLMDVWMNAYLSGEEHGFRNAQVTVIQPSGTVSFAMDSAATGIEPFFGHVVYKKVVDGSFMKLVNPLVKTALETLGYSSTEIEAILKYMDENSGKYEGAPFLKPDDYSVFDTANVNGDGERYIHYNGHVDMVAALTPFVSGAISKTVNLPSTATVQDFKDVILKAWQKGIKGITLYRDGSKFSQPLNQSLDNSNEGKELKDLTYKELLEKAKEYKEEKNIPKRVRASGIRRGRTHAATIGGVKIYSTVNRDEDGRIIEIYNTADKEGSLIMGLLSSLSKSISIMLQYGVPPEQISKMLRGQNFEPKGFVTGHPYIKNVSSIPDFLSKIIDLETGDYKHLQVKPSQQKFKIANSKKEHKKEIKEYVHEDAKEAYQNGERVYDGSICANCSSNRMVQNGTCKVCLDCGTTTGCS